MKTAIYIEDGVVQLVITPETKFEKDSINIFNEKPLEVKLFSGSFYDCRGGWVRQNALMNPGMHAVSDRSDDSLILKIKESTNNKKEK